MPRCLIFRNRLQKLLSEGNIRRYLYWRMMCSSSELTRLCRIRGNSGTILTARTAGSILPSCGSSQTKYVPPGSKRSPSTPCSKPSRRKSKSSLRTRKTVHCVYEHTPRGPSLRVIFAGMYLTSCCGGRPGIIPSLTSCYCGEKGKSGFWLLAHD